MGRRRKRKQERRSDQRSGGGWRENGSDQGTSVAMPDYLSPQAMDLLFGMPDADEFGYGLPVVNTCGGCREFVEDEVGGRGECLHPGSGVLSPWTDTEACAFYAGRRR